MAQAQVQRAATAHVPQAGGEGRRASAGGSGGAEAWEALWPALRVQAAAGSASGTAPPARFSVPNRVRPHIVLVPPALGSMPYAGRSPSVHGMSAHGPSRPR